MNHAAHDGKMGVLDPVCGMTVNPESAAGSFDYQGKTYYFCSTHCLHRFQQSPESFLNPQPISIAPAPKPATTQKYTCPMHPEIIRDGPGSCPICGMALEPLVASLDEEENHELKDMSRRFWVAVVLTIPVFALGMSDLIPGQPLQRLVPMSMLAWVQLILATPVVLWAGWPFFVRGWQSIVTRNLNMFTLIALGVAVGYVFSVIAVLAPGTFPASFHEAGGHVPVYFEAAAVITTLVLLGQVLELRARSQTGTAIKALLGLAPKTAHRIRDDGQEEEIPLARAGRAAAMQRRKCALEQREGEPDASVVELHGAELAFLARMFHEKRQHEAGQARRAEHGIDALRGLDEPAADGRGVHGLRIFS
jgi:Cu+-exporting ATPase